MEVKNNARHIRVDNVGLSFKPDNYLSQVVQDMNTTDTTLEFENVNEAVAFAKKLRHFITVTRKLRRFNDE